MDNRNNRAQSKGNVALSRSGGINIGFVLSQEQFPITQLLKYGQMAEQAGFDCIWTSDHWQPWQDNQGHAGQAWVTLAALGVQTSKLKMGTGVTCPTYRYNPAIVAQAFASLGMLYPGRVFLGVGAGEALNESASGGGWGEYQERAGRLVEAVELIRRLWTGEMVDHSGRYYNVNGKLYDVPTPQVPIYIAASGPDSMHLAGKHGDGLVSDGETATNPQMKAAFERGAREAGKDPSTMPVLAEFFMFVGEEEEAKKYAELWRFLPKAWETYVENPDPRDIERRAQQEVPIEDVLKKMKIGSDPQVHIEALQKLIDGGVSTIFVHSAQPDQERAIEFYSKEVLPKLKRQRLGGQRL